MSPSSYLNNSSNGSIRSEASLLPLVFTYSFIEDFLFFALHIDILNLSLGKADKNMQDVTVDMLDDIVASGLMILLVEMMINGLIGIDLQCRKRHSLISRVQANGNESLRK